MSTRHGSTSADTVETVTFTQDLGTIQILHKGNVSDPLYATVNGTAPTVEGDDTFAVLSGGFRIIERDGAAPTLIKMISSGAVDFEVST